MISGVCVVSKDKYEDIRDEILSLETATSALRDYGNAAKIQDILLRLLDRVEDLEYRAANMT